jgi:hypothetical protein
MRLHSLKCRCHNTWLCFPGWLRLLLAFTVVNVVGDFVSFPFVHSAWNALGFAGFFQNHHE